MVAACTRLDPAERCTLPALAAYLANNATALGADVGSEPAPSPATAGGVQGAGAAAASAMGPAPACSPLEHQAHAAQMLWGGAWGGMGRLPAQTAGHSADGTCAPCIPSASPGALLGAAPLLVASSNAAAMLPSGSGAYFSAPESPLVPAGCSATGCMGLGAGGTWEQPAAHPCIAGWRPGASVLTQPREPEGSSDPCTAGWSPWGGVPAQPQASGAELGPGSYPRIAGWRPWGGVPAQPLGDAGSPCIAGWSPWGGVPAHASGAPQELACGAYPCIGALPQPQLDAASQAQVAIACTAIEAFVAAQRGFLASAAHADAAALEDARLALVAACVPQQTVQDGSHAPGSGFPVAAGVGGGGGQAASAPGNATLTLEHARHAPVCPSSPARAAHQGLGALAASGGGPRWGTGVPGGDGRMRRARSRQRRRAEPYARGPRAAGLRTWRAPPGGHAWAPVGLADPCGWGPCAMAGSGGVLAPHSAWAMALGADMATGALCGYVCTLESGGRQRAPAAAAPLAPVVEAVPAAAASAYARQGVAAARVAAVLTGGCAAAGKAPTGAAVCLDARAG